MMRGVRFETQEVVFNSIDFHFELDTYVTQNRIVLNPVSASIPGRDPVYFRPQQGERYLQLSFSYVGENFLNDLDKFTSKLYNSRMPLRIILAREADRYYVAQIIELPTEDRRRLFSKAEVTAQLLRNYALRRWRDDEITPDNPDINFSMPIVPVQTEHILSGSSASIPYYNEGVDTPLVAYLDNVSNVTINLESGSIQFRKAAHNILVDTEQLRAYNDSDQSQYLVGDTVMIPHGSQIIRFHYMIRPLIAKQAEDIRYEDFLQGTPIENTEIFQIGEDGAILALGEGPGEFISREIDISTVLRPRRAVLSFIQNRGGSVEFDTRLNLNGQWTDWMPVGYDGTIQGITPDTDLSNAKIQYRARLNTYPDESGEEPVHLIYMVSITIESDQFGKLIIKNRKRFL